MENLKMTNYRSMAYECLEIGENNEAIKFLLKAIDAGGCISLYRYGA